MQSMDFGKRMTIRFKTLFGELDVAFQMNASKTIGCQPQSIRQRFLFTQGQPGMNDGNLVRPDINVLNAAGRNFSADNLNVFGSRKTTHKGQFSRFPTGTTEQPQ